MKVVCQNKRAYHDYHVEESFESGIALSGTEVKSLRQGKADLRDSYVVVRDGEAYVLNMHISLYSHGNISNHEPLRTRKLLLHKKEIAKLAGKAAQKGYSLIPLKVYFKGQRAKLEVGLARGKRLFEKREAIRAREARKEIDRAMKAKSR